MHSGMLEGGEREGGGLPGALRAPQAPDGGRGERKGPRDSGPGPLSPLTTCKGGPCRGEPPPAASSPAAVGRRRGSAHSQGRAHARAHSHARAHAHTPTAMHTHAPAGEGEPASRSPQDSGKPRSANLLQGTPRGSLKRLLSAP